VREEVEGGEDPNSGGYQLTETVRLKGGGALGGVIPRVLGRKLKF
jgi:hypothetical protein